MSAEFEMIAELTDGLAIGPDVRLGPGDDAAVLVPRGDIVITTDVLIENVHFKRAWSSAFQTGRKAVAVNVSDVEAMGAEPSAVVIGLAFPRNLDRRWVSDFQEGVRGVRPGRGQPRGRRLVVVGAHRTRGDRAREPVRASRNHPGGREDR